MNPFGWGVVFGCAGSLAVAVAAAGVGWRRYERLQRRTRQAEHLAELGTLTGGLAHEIKNPLSTVQLNLQLLREDLDPDSPATARIVRRLTTVQKETGRLRDILDDFLRYAGKVELDSHPTELRGMLEELVDFFSPQAQIQRVQLRLTPGAPITASLDPRLIKQAVLNLMINALQAMPAGGGEILLSAAKQDRKAIIAVTDTGPGMTLETVARIFDAYYSTKRGGTGLGLAIARRIVTEHGGRISVASELGKGSVFSIELDA